MAQNKLETIVHADWDESWPRATHDGLAQRGIKVFPHLTPLGLIEKINDVKPDMLITEMALDAGSMWRAHGLEYMMVLAKTNPDLPVLVISSMLTADRIFIVGERGPKFAAVTVKQDWPGGTGQLVRYIEDFWQASREEAAYKEWLKRGFRRS